jgi:hypothetical protein
MDIFDEEILKFWAALQNQAVKYIMVGGYANNLHGFQRYTGDIDIALPSAWIWLLLQILMV